MSETTLEPLVLQWARRRAGLSTAGLAGKIGVETAEVVEWESTGRIQCESVEILAEKTKTPFGYLFLKAPPERKLPVADFRRTDDTPPVEPSEDLLDIIHSAQRRQNWYREYLMRIGEKPLPFVGRASNSIPSDEAAADIRSTLGIGFALTESSDSWEEAMRKTIEKAEDAGILFLRIGYAGNYTHRKLSVEEFRGFALADKYAPLIFVNGADAPAAQMFTISHEIAHIWIGASGVSNLNETYAKGAEIESFCNKVAAEVLLPIEQIRYAWNPKSSPFSEIERLSRRYKISKIVVARRAHDAQFLSDKNYSEFFKREIRVPKGKSGGRYYTNQQYQNSRRFSVALLNDTRSGRTLYRDAMRLLGIKKEDTFKKFARSLQIDI